MIKVAVVGAGHWGPNLIRNFNGAEGCEVVRVVDASQARLDLIAKRFPGVATSTEAADAFDDPVVDACVIATPTVTHYEIVQQALAANKHVLVEKPITTDVAQADELVELAKNNDRILMVGHIFLYNQGVRKVKQYIGDGTLGRLYYVSMSRTNLGPIRMDVNAAWDLASHDISITNYWLDAQPVTVSATGHDWINPGRHDAVFVTLHYPNDILVNLHASWLNPRKARDITVVGDARMLTLDDMNGLEPIRIYDKVVTEDRITVPFVDSNTTFRASVRNGDITIPNVTLGEPLKDECLEFLRCIQEGKAPESDGVFGAGVVRVLEAIDRSLAAKGREEKV